MVFGFSRKINSRACPSPNNDLFKIVVDLFPPAAHGDRIAHLTGIHRNRECSLKLFGAVGDRLGRNVRCLLHKCSVLLIVDPPDIPRHVTQLFKALAERNMIKANGV